MSFLLYERKSENGSDYLHLLESNYTFSLAGNNLIKKIWEKREKPINSGWKISASDLINELNPKEINKENLHLIIDFHPNTKERIGIVELKDIYLYTYGNSETVDWTPMMLKLKKIYYEEFQNPDQIDYKDIQLKKKKIKYTNNGVITEFLYLKGDNYHWNWGKAGMTNATFIESEAREFFKEFF